MNIVPAGIEQHINRVDRQRSLWIGVSLATVAVGSFLRLFWMLYVSMTFGWFVGPMAFHIVLSLVVGTVAAVGAAGFLNRYFKGPESNRI